MLLLLLLLLLLLRHTFDIFVINKVLHATREHATNLQVKSCHHTRIESRITHHTSHITHHTQLDAQCLLC